MRKLLITSFLITSCLISSLYAAGDVVKVIVTEKIPGADCTCVADGASMHESDGTQTWLWEAACGDLNTRKYECSVKKWLWSFQEMIATVVRWFVNIVTLLGVLAIVGAGIMMMFGSDSEEYTKKAKWWAKNIVIGLVLLFTFRYILQLLAPWIYQ